MKIQIAELACVALLWVGAAGVAASALLNTQAQKILCVSEFSAVIAIALIVKFLLVADSEKPKTQIPQ